MQLAWICDRMSDPEHNPQFRRRWAPPQFIAKALGGQRAGSSWLAPCPAHEDGTPSLALRDGDAGRVLVHCHAGCDQEAVAQQMIVAAEAGAAP